MWQTGAKKRRYMKMHPVSYLRHCEKHCLSNPDLLVPCQRHQGPCQKCKLTSCPEVKTRKDRHSYSAQSLRMIDSNWRGGGPVPIESHLSGSAEGHAMVPCRNRRREMADSMELDSRGLQSINTWEKSFQATGTNTLLKIICESLIPFAYLFGVMDGWQPPCYLQKGALFLAHWVQLRYHWLSLGEAPYFWKPHFYLGGFD